MSKITIFLCAVLFASAVHGSDWAGALQSVQEKVDAAITALVDKVREEVDVVNQKALELVAKLQEAVLSFEEKIADEVNTVLDKVQAEIDKLTGNVEGVDVTECNELAAHLEYTAHAAIANMSLCVVDKLETANGYVDNIIKVSENVLGNLSAIRDQAHHCGDNVDGVKTAAAAIVCTNLAGVNATWTAAKAVPALTINLNKLTYLLATLQPSLAYCSTTNGLLSFYNEASTIVEKTKECIQQKVNEVSGVTPEVEWTTEEVYTTEQVLTN